MESDRPKIEKLRGADNWQQWQFVMHILLDSENLLDICDGTLKMPKEEEKNYEKNMAIWKKSDKTAKRVIVTSVESKPLQFLINCEGAYEMWMKLHSIYDMKSEENVLMIQKQFFDFKWDPEGNISQHISKIETLANKLKKLNAGVPDSMVMARVLSTLPAKFNHFHSAWDSTDSTKRTLENLTTRLLTEELRLEKQENVDEAEVTALFFEDKIE